VANQCLNQTRCQTQPPVKQNWEKMKHQYIWRLRISNSLFRFNTGPYTTRKCVPSDKFQL
jgi:hypothetical protein